MREKGKVIRMEDLPWTSLVEGAKSRLMMGKRIMLSFIEMEPGMKFPLHSHNSEQIMIVLEGGMRQRLGDKVYDLKPGDVCIIPSNVVHGGEISGEGCKAIDVFTPPREDYVEHATK